jgi:hypothetical protein
LNISVEKFEGMPAQSNYLGCDHLLPPCKGKAAHCILKPGNNLKKNIFFVIQQLFAYSGNSVSNFK